MKNKKNMYTIAIIGAGQLGSRHLQGLKTAALDMRIYVVEPDAESLKTAAERYAQVAENSRVQELILCDTQAGLPETLDLVVIATGSAPRAMITRELLRSRRVKNILFEKVLFQAPEEYGEIGTLLERNSVNAWVNCPRRMFAHYRKLRETTESLEKIDYRVTGRNWGLGCNAIHFIDNFAMLTGETDMTFDLSGIEPRIYPSKRPGYVEFCGTVTGRTPKGSTITLVSTDTLENPPVVTVQGAGFSAEIAESAGKMTVNGAEEPIRMLYQSQLTGLQAEQILSEGRSDLASYSESARLHLHWLTPLIDVYNRLNGGHSDRCPIT